MVNDERSFNQSETGKYFERVTLSITTFHALSGICSFVLVSVSLFRLNSLQRGTTTLVLVF